MSLIESKKNKALVTPFTFNSNDLNNTFLVLSQYETVMAVAI